MKYRIYCAKQTLLRINAANELRMRTACQGVLKSSFVQYSHSNSRTKRVVVIIIMNLRSTGDGLDAAKECNDDFYLIYFKIDDCVSVVKKQDVVECGDKKCLEAGSTCQVKEKGRTHSGCVITYGTKANVINVEEQFLCGLYTPDFLDLGSSSDDEPKDNVMPTIKGKKPKRKRKECKSNKSAKMEKPAKKHRNLPKQQSKIKILTSASTCKETDDCLSGSAVATPTGMGKFSPAYLSPFSTISSLPSPIALSSNSKCYTPKLTRQKEDTEIINSLVHRIERLENQYDFLIQRCFTDCLKTSTISMNTSSVPSDVADTCVQDLMSEAPPPTTPMIVKAEPTIPIESTPSSNINVEGLMNPDDVIKKHSRYLKLATIGRLAVRLSVEAYFGNSELKKCTVVGCQGKPPLPKDKLLHMKQKLMSLFPQFLSSRTEFEPHWSKCVAAINHHAAGLRSKDISKVITLQ